MPGSFALAASLLLLAPATDVMHTSLPVESRNGVPYVARPGADSSGAARTVRATRVPRGTRAPKLDGVLDDEVWQRADSLSDFVQVEPTEGEPARYPTVARIVLGDDAVHVGIRAYDPEPSRIAAQLTRRDEFSASDWLYVGLDADLDRRTAFVFMISAAGVKRDLTLSDDVGGDDTWDAIWEVATRIDSLGWVAEVRIPFSALRFASEGQDDWGFQLQRLVQREQEISVWSPRRRDESRLVARFGSLRGVGSLQSRRPLEVTPYAVASARRAPLAAGYPFRGETDAALRVGGDVKYGITSNLTLDLTVNPDFGQVEADPAEVNLTTYESFFAERRPFFTEGADIFRFTAGIGDNEEQLFYPRRIGRRPQGEADARGGWADSVSETTILGAAKLSGRTAGGWSIGVLEAVTAEERVRVRDASGASFTDVVEPLTSYTVARVGRDLNGGRTRIGTAATSVLRRLDGRGLEEMRTSALAGGIDASHRWGADWRASGAVLASRVTGSRAAILATQHSPVHAFQRPDEPHLGVDSSATSLSGWGANYSVAKQSGRLIGGVLGLARSPGFETNDVGFQYAADDIITVGWSTLRQLTPGRVFRTKSLGVEGWEVRNFGWRQLDVAGSARVEVQLLNYWKAYVRAGRNFRRVQTRMLRGGPAVRENPSNLASAGVTSDERRPLSFDLDGNLYREEESGSERQSLSLTGRWRPSSAMQLSLSPFYQRANNATQYVTTGESTRGTHYLVGRLRQHTTGTELRASYTFTPELSLQLVAQPFLSAGRYDGYREVRSPMAARFAERYRLFEPGAVRTTADSVALDIDGNGTHDLRFARPDYGARNLNANAVLRWEYRLGSTIYVVWSHGRQEHTADGRFQPGRDFGSLMDERGSNVWLVKASWWLPF